VDPVEAQSKPNAAFGLFADALGRVPGNERLTGSNLVLRWKEGRAEPAMDELKILIGERVISGEDWREYWSCSRWCRIRCLN